MWCGKAWGGGKRPTGVFDVPKYLHWDLWLGPAQRPFAPGVYHPAQWRRWWDFGSGTLGDMACHLLDLPFWALGLRHPISVESIGPPVQPGNGAPGFDGAMGVCRSQCAGEGDSPIFAETKIGTVPRREAHLA